MLQKIINLTSRQNGNDVISLSRWLRCLFNLTLAYDENISLKCLDQVTQIAAKKHGVCLNLTISALFFLSTLSAHNKLSLHYPSWQPLHYHAP